MRKFKSLILGVCLLISGALATPGCIILIKSDGAVITEDKAVNLDPAEVIDSAASAAKTAVEVAADIKTGGAAGVVTEAAKEVLENAKE